MEKSNERIKWLDSLKGFTILMVVVAHIADMYYDRGLFPDYLSIFSFLSSACSSFMMPLFFILSGSSFAIAYLRRDKGGVTVNKKKAIKQVVNITLIYLIWSIIYILSKMFLKTDALVELGIHDIFLLPIKAVSLFWYLYVLELCYALTILTIENRRLYRAVVMLSALICMVMTGLHISTGYTFDRAGLYYIFFSSGVLIVLTNKYEVLSDLKRVVPMAIFGIISMMLSYKYLFKTMLDDRFVWYQIPCLGMFFSFAICIGVIGVFIKLENRDPVRLNVAGMHSLEIYLMHRYIMMILRKILGGGTLLELILVYIIEIGGCLIIPIVFAKVSKKMNIYNFLFKPINLINRSKN